MTVYDTVFALYQSTVLRRRLTVAIATAAQQVMAEPGTQPNHANRLTWAKASLQNAPAMAETMMWGLLSNASIQATAENTPDSDVQFQVNSLIDSYAIG